MRRIKAIREHFQSRDIPVLYVLPAHLKQFATGRGNASKELVREVVTHRWGVSARDSDQADAAVLARMAHCAFLFANRGNIRALGLSPEQRQVMRRILN